MLRSDAPGVITCVSLARAVEYAHELNLTLEPLPADTCVPDDWQDLSAADWKQVKALLT